MEIYRIEGRKVIRDRGLRRREMGELEFCIVGIYSFFSFFLFE